MKKLKNLAFLLAVSSMIFILPGCNNDEASPTGNVTLKLKGAGSPTFSGRLGGRTEATVTITDFQISIREVIFKSDGDDDGQADDSTDVVFFGPYQVDLLNGVDALTQTLGSASVPNGIYEEMRFKFHKDEDLATSEPLYDRSIYIAGTIDDVPFVMWHDTSENLDIEYPNGIAVQDNQVNLIVNFYVDQFLNSLKTIDISQAADGNQDGTIEIYPNDPDGNSDIADDLKDNIKEAADLLED